MRTIIIWGCLVIAFFVPCMSDIYLHVPHGSNNRLSGEGENVQAANRLFDSQNNGKAGYNVGDALDSAIRAGTLPESRQLPMKFYMSGIDPSVESTMDIMWTNQHGTGPKTDDMVESQVILQYMCQPFPEGRMVTKNPQVDFQYHTIRNGQVIATQPTPDKVRTEATFAKKDRGLHEPLEYYRAMLTRNREKGLFTADQNLRGNTAIYTRQNAQGTRRGYEVPEERDYYPYWGPSPWKDIAILVSDEKTKKLMEDYVNSPEYGVKYLCIHENGKNGIQCPQKAHNIRNERCVSQFITETNCKKNGGTWTKFVTNYIERTAGVLSTCKDEGNMKLTYGRPYEPHKISQGAEALEQYLLLQEPPKVAFASSTVVNHNGMSMDGKFSSFKWRIPAFPSNVTQRCVLRIRYNITTDDVPRGFTAKDNNKVKNNPKTKATSGQTDLQLALNTAQLGRTFQDRTHVFLLIPRSHLPEKHQHSHINYITSMGKRGNIVQTYPAMEYRFFPERVQATTDTVLCFVWSGSNNHPAGRAGQGRDKTDRHNICYVKEGCSSLKPTTCEPVPLEVVDHVSEYDAKKLNDYLNEGCFKGAGKLQAQLDNAPASCNPPCFRITKPGKYCYMSTRNNNFSNRRHVGEITVVQAAKKPSKVSDASLKDLKIIKGRAWKL
ncbi:protein DD3-3 [Acropora millepora]|uniref:protein DD3-3 n=1 Tax=Acropora millepora TaxID=45264 RepID=UPI001CF24129|nr:protein DD3-3 [Acropora millepora]